MKDALNETFPSLWVLYCEVIDLVGSFISAFLVFSLLRLCCNLPIFRTGYKYNGKENFLLTYEILKTKN